MDKEIKILNNVKYNNNENLLKRIRLIWFSK